MALDASELQTIEHDVLVIGAGGAGLRAAIECSAQKLSTGVISKSLLGKASDRALQFKATDLEREVSDEAPADVSQPGAVTVPAHMLHEM